MYVLALDQGTTSSRAILFDTFVVTTKGDGAIFHKISVRVIGLRIQDLHLKTQFLQRRHISIMLFFDQGIAGGSEK